MRVADHRGLGHFGMGDQRRFHLGGAHTVTRDVDHIVHAAGDPIVAIGVTAAAVTREVVASVVREIGLLEPVMIAPDGAHLARPAVFQRQNALSRDRVDFFTRLRIQNHRLHTKERLHRRARFQRMRPRQRGQQVPAGFRLPPCVDDGAAALTHNLIVPVPGFGVDRFAHGAQDSQ
ncbi:hypothetical protein PRI8871_03903 [Pseudoprimorskyibacter insulae]|uniref:Uncharacterized protein n=1 Tax=Pseudoprimorskyibacter insulae TaxID=1695997 RepID=A0A2R8B1C0_9RHOB|nr:hypothetical protein PRI8871_03903 [Pseudoprimorskyibacter insulae]